MRQFFLFFVLLQICSLNVNGQKYVVVGIDELEGKVKTSISKDSITYDVKGVRFVMMGVQGGTFTMGNTSEQKRRNSDEIPTHQVSINTFEPTLKSKACLKCLYFTIIIFDLCRYLEYFSYLYTINQTE